MARFIPEGKLSKKARKELNRRRRVTWEFSPVTKTVESRKLYSRKRKTHDRGEDYGMGHSVFGKGSVGPAETAYGEGCLWN